MSGGPPPVPGGRTPEEREAARREREARRSGKPPETRRQAPSEDWLARARRLTGDRNGTGQEPPRLTRRERGPGGRPSGARVLAGLAAAAVALVAAWFVLSLWQPFGGDGEGRVRVVIPKGSGVGQIADILARRKVIGSSFFFGLRARSSGKSDQLKPGSYSLREGMSYSAALDVLTRGPAPNVVTLTVPEGRSRREVARLIGDQLEGDYLAATRRSRALDPREYGGRRAEDLEGFLFPATYELKRGTPMSVLVERQLSAFRRQFEGVDMAAARRRNLTPYDVLTIASLVEREAGVPKERRLIASVIHNRLRQGIPLGIDASVRFFTGNWTRPLRMSELQRPDPYNTRVNKGLPPGPIGSPGIDSIRAAASPARSGYLFYVVKPGTCGEHEFAETNQEFLRDKARYDEERARRGGKSPTSC